MTPPLTLSPEDIDRRERATPGGELPSSRGDRARSGPPPPESGTLSRLSVYLNTISGANPGSLSRNIDSRSVSLFLECLKPKTPKFLGLFNSILAPIHFCRPLIVVDGVVERIASRSRRARRPSEPQTPVSLVVEPKQPTSDSRLDRRRNRVGVVTAEPGVSSLATGKGGPSAGATSRGHADTTRAPRTVIQSHAVSLAMPLSARNELAGTVSSVERSGIMAEVAIDLGDDQTVTSVITSASADRLDVTEGDDVAAVIKATEVMVRKD